MNENEIVAQLRADIERNTIRQEKYRKELQILEETGDGGGVRAVFCREDIADYDRFLAYQKELLAAHEAALDRWVKTEDRLPEEGQEVRFETDEGMFCGEFSDGDFLDQFDNLWAPEYVPHWHPLPPPPELKE